jgi:type III secretion system FlhB-like substrate exporter
MLKYLKQKLKPKDQFSLFVDQINKHIRYHEEDWTCCFKICGTGFEKHYPAIITYYNNMGIKISIDKDDLVVDITNLLEEKEIKEEIQEHQYKQIAKFVIFFVLLSFSIIVLLNHSH